MVTVSGVGLRSSRRSGRVCGLYRRTPQLQKGDPLRPGVWFPRWRR